MKYTLGCLLMLLPFAGVFIFWLALDYRAALSALAYAVATVLSVGYGLWLWIKPVSRIDKKNPPPPGTKRLYEDYIDD